MKRMVVTVAAMALIVGSQGLAEARGGGRSGGINSGAGMMQRTGGGAGDMIRDRQQDRLRDPALGCELDGTGNGDQLGDRQQDRLRDPALHTDTVDLPTDTLAED
jgi:hypothetical protein